MTADYRNGGVTYEDLITLTAWMAENDYSPGEIAYAVEKPWRYLDELALAKAGEAESVNFPPCEQDEAEVIDLTEVLEASLRVRGIKPKEQP